MLVKRIWMRWTRWSRAGCQLCCSCEITIYPLFSPLQSKSLSVSPSSMQSYRLKMTHPTTHNRLLMIQDVQARTHTHTYFCSIEVTGSTHTRITDTHVRSSGQPLIWLAPGSLRLRTEGLAQGQGYLFCQSRYGNDYNCIPN